MAKNGTGALYLADLGYPMLPQNATEQEKFDELQDYLFRLTEALRWTLEHLDESNFNSNFFLDFAVGERYEPLMIAWAVSTHETTHYDVEDELGEISGEVATALAVTNESTRVDGHTAITDATGSNRLALTTTPVMMTAEVSKEE